MENDLDQFLSDRGIPEGTIQKLKDDKIDCSMLLLMEDDILEAYLPAYGDRLAAVAFCKSRERKSVTLENIRNKIRNQGMKRKLSSSRNDIDNGKHLKGNKHANRDTRRVELGWMDFDESIGAYKQVRAPKGGGTRHLKMNKSKQISEVLTMGKKLFFPDEKSLKGHQNTFSFQITDFCERQLDEDVTVGELYENTKVAMLRLYVYTKRLTNLPETSHTNTQSETATQVDNCVTVEPDYDLPDPNIALPYLNIGLPDPNIDLLDPNIDLLDPNIDLLDPNNGISDTTAMPGSADSDMKKHMVRIRRGHAFDDLKNAFIDDPGLSKMDFDMQVVLPNGSIENGEGVGVFRDVITEFWTDFYERCTLGTDAKVPFLRHDYQETEWEAIGRIFAKGWFVAGYLPLQLAVPFLEEVLYENHTDGLMDAFMNYVAVPEKEVLKAALQDFASVDGDELLETLDTYQAKRVPTKDTLESIVIQIAHKELYQAPLFVINCWRPVVKDVAAALPQSKLHSLINDRLPIPKNVVKHIIFPEVMSTTEKDVARFLTKYVKEMKQEQVQRFLRYCTGADILLDQYISVYFVEMSEFERRPVGHTCTCTLQMPNNYANYPDLRAEFNAILNSSIWSMDFV